MNNLKRIDVLKKNGILPKEDLIALISTFDKEDRAYAAEIARLVSIDHFGKKIYSRGLIEISNYCRNDCYYCGIRRSNDKASRYRLTEEDILSCCSWGYDVGFRTFVLQGGEDEYFTDDRLEVICKIIKNAYPDCALTLSLGEKEKSSYRRFFDAGADRYLLRQETACESHYSLLHPKELSLARRKQCLVDLKNIGFQTGCGIMVGSPYQTYENIVEDLFYMKELEPHMIGIGPFIPHKDTPFKDHPAGNVEDSLFILSIIRLMHPRVLLPATTALGTIQSDGREQGILAGANVVMPNISPPEARKKYMLYNNKIGTAEDPSENVAFITDRIRNIGYEVVSERGDYH